MKGITAILDNDFTIAISEKIVILVFAVKIKM